MFTMEITRLIERCRQGDADALGELYKAYAQRMRGVCRRYISDEQTVEDVLHDAFVIIFEDEERDVRGVPSSEVVRMIDRLPEGYGQVFRLSVFEGMTHKEIASMLGIEPHSSSSQLARAKKMLRKMMQQYWVAGLLLLLVPVTFLLLKKGDTVVKDEKPVVAKQKDTPKESQKDSRTEQLSLQLTPCNRSLSKQWILSRLIPYQI